MENQNIFTDKLCMEINVAEQRYIKPSKNVLNPEEHFRCVKDVISSVQIGKST